MMTFFCGVVIFMLRVGKSYLGLVFFSLLHGFHQTWKIVQEDLLQAEIIAGWQKVGHLVDDVSGAVPRSIDSCYSCNLPSTLTIDTRYSFIA